MSAARFRVGGACATSPAELAEELREKVRKKHAEGLKDVEIARWLGVSARTVGTYRRALGLGRVSSSSAEFCA